MMTWSAWPDDQRAATEVPRNSGHPPKFWRRYLPVLMGLKSDEQKKAVAALRKKHPEAIAHYETEVATAAVMRKVLLALPYAGLGTGDVDYYQVFAWRMLHLVRSGGNLGVVFPRSLLNSAGCAEWRAEVLSRCTLGNVSVLTNDKKWVFDEVDVRYSIVLISLQNDRAVATPTVGLAGPFRSYEEYLTGRYSVGHLLVSDITSATTGATFPSLPNADSAAVLSQMRKHPRLDVIGPSWDFRPVREFDATNDRGVFDAGGQGDGRWPVYTGASFNLWEPDTGERYAFGDPDTIIAALMQKRSKQVRHATSAFNGLSDAWARDFETLPLKARALRSAISRGPRTHGRS